MKAFLLSLAAFLALAGCASRNTNQDSLGQNVGQAAGSATAQTRQGFGDAALTPLEDLNLRRREIPPLLAAMPNPYDLPPELSCGALELMIAELDGVLGPDWDAAKPDERLKTEVLADEAAEAALGAVESGVTGWIPFRGLIRKATGAESHEKKYNRAYKIGAQRRTYLKGYGLAKGCPAPARPDFLTLHTQEDEVIVYKEDSPDDPAETEETPG
ncbi:MAG TPA: hypothetical protein PKV67_02080 [Hyphomonas sp.]|nr:hypothetical protein [Hyphomonas sp.]HRK66369.1 hypothetical protein [Hyphomonas sp.]